MNIVQAYIKFNKQLLIFITGIPGCGKTTLSKHIGSDLKLKFIDQFNYYKKNYDKMVELQDGTKMINWYTDDAIDWDELNNDINKYKDSGLIVSGFSLPKDKISSEADYHVHLNISKLECLERRRKFIEDNKDKYEEEFKILNTPTEKLRMNQIIYPYFIKSTEGEKINKFLTVNAMSDDEVYDTVFDLIIDFIMKSLKQEKKIYGKESDEKDIEIEQKEKKKEEKKEKKKEEKKNEEKEESDKESDEEEEEVVTGEEEEEEEGKEKETDDYNSSDITTEDIFQDTSEIDNVTEGRMLNQSETGVKDLFTTDDDIPIKFVTYN